MPVFSSDAKGKAEPVKALPWRDKEQPASFGEQYGASYLLDTTLGALQLSDRYSSETGQPTPDNYDALDDIAGYEDNAERFISAQTPRDVLNIKRQIAIENEIRPIRDNAGFVVQLLAQGADPLNMIPVARVAKGLKAGDRILQSSRNAAAAGFVSSTAQESILQTAQTTRTAEESLTNIGATTILSSALGVGGGVINPNAKASAEDFLTIPKEGSADRAASIPMDDWVDSVGAAKVVNTTKAQERMVEAMGADKFANAIKLSPAIRVASSPSVESTRILQELADTAFYFKKNEEGIASPVSAERKARMHQGKLARGLSQYGNHYKDYRLKSKEAGNKPLSRLAFSREVGKAMRRNDAHEISEVAQAAKTMRREVFDPLKDEAIGVKLLPEDVNVKTAASYLTRIYNKTMIAAKRNEFKDITSRWLSDSDVNLSLGDADFIADEIIDTLLNSANGTIHYRPIATSRGPLKERTFNIPDELIESFLESDVETIAGIYTRTMAADVELQRAFGSPTMQEQLAKIGDDYNALIDAATTEAERIKLQKAKKSDLEDISAMAEILRGTYGNPSNPDSFFVKSGRIARGVNFLSLLGGMTISSLSDLANLAFSGGGLRSVMGDVIVPMTRNIQQFKLAKSEAADMAGAFERVLSHRLQELSELTDPYHHKGKFERGLDAVTDTFARATLMNHWNDTMKSVLGLKLQSWMYRKAGKVLSPKDVKYLARVGIDQAMFSRISSQMQEFGQKIDGSAKSNKDVWTDRIAAKHYEAFLSSESDRLITTPGIGDKPLLAHSEAGKVVLQFKSFALAATNRLLISGLQQDKVLFLNTLMLSVGMGAMTSVLYSGFKGDEIKLDANHLIKEGITRSGLLGAIIEMNGLIALATRNSVSIERALGEDVSTRFRSRSALGQLLGPTVGSAQSLVQITGAMATADWRESDTHAVRRLLPFQNLFYIRALLDELEEGVNDALGVSN